MLRSLPTLAVSLAITQAAVPISSQATNSVVAQTPRHSSYSISSSPTTGVPATKTDYGAVSREDHQPQVTVNIPAPAPAPWALHDRISWVSHLVLAIMGYIGIVLALSALKKIERQTRSVESSAAAAADQARAALLTAQAIIDSERPWISITVEPYLTDTNSFVITATNRGRSPAQIVTTVDQHKFAIDERQLPAVPDYQQNSEGFPPVPIILLSGESTAIKAFRREDLKGICESDERLRRVESWEDKVFIYGKIIYRDLIAHPDNRTHETTWCCWYIHGRQKSGLVIAGPPGYNLHT